MSMMSAGSVDGTKQSQLTHEMDRLNELRQQLILQEQKVQTLTIGEHVNTESVIETLVHIKEREVALALMRVAELTRQLEQLKCGHLDRRMLSDSTLTNGQLLDRNPEMLRSIVSPLSPSTSTLPRSKSSNTVSPLTVSSIRDLRSSADELGDKRCNSLPLTSRARGSVKTAVRGSTDIASQAVDCNDNLVTKKAVVDISDGTVQPSFERKRCEGQTAGAHCQQSDTLQAVSSRTGTQADQCQNSQSVDKTDACSTNERDMTSPCNAQVISSSEKQKTLNFGNRAEQTVGKMQTKSNDDSRDNYSVGHEFRLSDALAYQDRQSMLPSSAKVPSSAIGVGVAGAEVSDIKIARTVCEVAPVHSPVVDTSPPMQQISLQELPDVVNGLTGANEHQVPDVRVEEAPSVKAHSPPDVKDQSSPDDVDSALNALKSSSLTAPSTGRSSFRCRQIMAGSAASRYNNISSHLYGGWLEPSPSPASPTNSDSVVAVASIGSPVPDSTAVDASPSSADREVVIIKDDVDSVSDSENSYASSDVDVTGDIDSADDQDESVRLDDSQFKHNDSFAKNHWHLHAVASPPPRRFVFRKPDESVSFAAATDHTSDDVEHRTARRSRRVTFDPLTLSLNAALEGELDTLKSIFCQMDDPNKANEDGLTVLHNGVCSGCFEVLEFLIDSGCDVNVADCDGWTPLHCAASSNNLDAVRLLVEHGASLMALSKYPDFETPLQKCSPDSPGFHECVQYMTDMLELVGTANDAAVYTVADYSAANSDELSFKAGDQLTILRQGDEDEPLWWWARKQDGVEGFVPPNLVAFYRQSASRSLIETSC